jgi:hypothetical protein
MNWKSTAVKTIKSRRVWRWELAGIIIYALPVTYRFATQSVAIPFLDFPGHWIGYWIPGNLLEKILVNAFFPGGAGAILGETFFATHKNAPLKGKSKYLPRLAGALFQQSLWSSFQYLGYELMIAPFGFNIFESALLLPLNFTLASLSIFTPDVVNLLGQGIKKLKKANR